MISTENLFSGTKWDIIREISEKKQSPLELANKLNTSIANISQQLRLLEASNLVKTEKTRESEKGKPRVMYSLSKDFVFFVSLNNGGSEKKMIEADTHHKVISRIWQIKNTEIHYELEKLYFELEKDDKKEPKDIDAIAFDQITNSVHIFGKKVSLKTSLLVKFVPFQNIEKNNLFIIYKRGGL